MYKKQCEGEQSLRFIDFFILPIITFNFFRFRIFKMASFEKVGTVLVERKIPLTLYRSSVSGAKVAIVDHPSAIVNAEISFGKLLKLIFMLFSYGYFQQLLMKTIPEYLILSSICFLMVPRIIHLVIFSES